MIIWWSWLVGECKIPWWDINWNMGYLWLVGGWPIPLKNDGVKVSWDDDIPNRLENNKCSKPPSRVYAPWCWYIYLIFLAYVSGLNFREYPHNLYGLKNGTFTYLHFRILKLPLTSMVYLPTWLGDFGQGQMLVCIFQHHGSHMGEQKKQWILLNSCILLVGGLEPWNFMTFHILGIKIPTDELIFFRGVGIPPTSIYCVYKICFSVGRFFAYRFWIDVWLEDQCWLEVPLILTKLSIEQHVLSQRTADFDTQFWGFWADTVPTSTVALLGTKRWNHRRLAIRSTKDHGEFSHPPARRGHSLGLILGLCSGLVG